MTANAQTPRTGCQHIDTYKVGCNCLPACSVEDVLLGYQRDLAAAKAKAEVLRVDAERYRWLRERLYGFDADFCENGLGVIFKFPEDSRIGVGQALDAAIDAAAGDNRR
jgi:hypothetical protein